MPAVISPSALLGDVRRKLDQSQIYDRVMRCPVIAFSLLILCRDVLAFSQHALHDRAILEQFDIGLLAAMLARISQWMFVLLLSIQPLFRLRPIAKSEDMLPRVAALMAVGIPLTFMLLDRAPSSVAFNLTSVVFSLLANVACVVTAGVLGRSLSVMPEARRLVRNGPYAVVRHPLYLFEILGTGAVALQYRSLSAVGLLLAAVALQAARARCEEGVLDRAFRDFAAYRAATSFLLPAEPWRFLASFTNDIAARRLLAAIMAAMLATLVAIAVILQRLSA